MRDEILDLICARYEATRAICGALDEASDQSDAGIGALYYILGVVKDPTTIQWLRSRLNGPQGALIRRDWVVGWMETAQWPRIGKWLDCPERWAEFLVELCERTPVAERKFELITLVRWAARNGDVVRYYRRLAENETDERQISLDSLLRREGAGILTCDELSLAVTRLWQTHGLDWFLTGSWFVPCEKVVPILISAFDRELTEAQREQVQGALERLTLAECATPAEWKEWWRKNGEARRADWALARFQEVDASLPGGIERVRRFLGDAHWRDEPLLFPFLVKWGRYKELHPALLSYLWLRWFFPESRLSALQPLADAVLRANPGMSTSDINALKWYGYISAGETWREFVTEMRRQRAGDHGTSAPTDR